MSRPAEDPVFLACCVVSLNAASAEDAEQRLADILLRAPWVRFVDTTIQRAPQVEATS